ncbi:hypothetical protein [Chryseobacterium gallinarum]|uniref:PBCV-specific basic adaptor domain-containing protein n=1 Tax=Chryseobacterium gallinarum TaxID=1324352 RepID=A0ABX6KT96_CHRGL|nr:hypothetical protein [Chryseobacterium gallinarum]QIY91828.1 hypothetical protein FOB44_14720 [Chryseobacterium gallinarum]
MKKLLFTSLLAIGLLLPTPFSATTNTHSSVKEYAGKKPKKSKTKKSRKSKSTSSRYSRSYSQSSGGCTYNGHQLYVGQRGGCYYYSGSSKQYVDRSYCSGCN